MSCPKRFLLRLAKLALLVASISLPVVKLAGQQVDPRFFADMRWRLIGPFRGGRALAATGVPGQPNVFYFGAVGGGVWKTTNAGRTWTPIFDSEPIASIGAIAVAPSDPNVIYVGSGEADMRSDISYGNGMYKSADAGKTWTRIGLEDSQQIGRILVDPRSPDAVYAAVLGHAYGPNLERGVFRSKDGGKSWQKILFRDGATGAIDLAFDPRDPQTIYAALWQTRRPPWSIYPPSNGPGSGLYKSTDGGDTWRRVKSLDLPFEGLGRMGIAVAPSDPNRVYLIADAKEGGLYRSDDAGQNWRRMDSEPRIWGRGWYFGGVTVDPKDPDTVYVANTSLYRSRDGGKSFDAIKGAPGGDDYHSLWIDPDDPNRMIVSSDQGAIISVDSAKTWTSWYNQPTAQLYHVITDNRFPYWIYGAQQDSGAVAVISRSNSSSISFRDWRPVGAGGESGYIAPDPLDPDIVYGVSFGGAVVRYDMNTSQAQDISPSLAQPDVYRHAWTLPLVFSRRDPHQLYFGAQVLFRTANGGESWQIISPDLTREDPGVPPNLDPPTAADAPAGNRRGVIYTIAPSPLRDGEIWIGTDDGFIQVTRDGGKTWQNVTPPELTPWSKVALIEASRHQANTVYAAVDRHRLDDYQAYIYRTRDGGKTWQRISKGIPEGSFVNAVREDPARAGLLYAGTETGVFVSFNDGGDWQPLQLNLPNASVRDLVIHDNDLVIATHGRSFWILDDITPLREIQAQGTAIAAAGAWLFEAQPAFRVRPGSFEGTPLPAEVAQGENPPAGAILNYYLKSKPSAPVVLEILDGNGKLVRRYSSADEPQRIDPTKLDIPTYWIHPAKPLSADPGVHRFVWDLRYPSSTRSSEPALDSFGVGGGPWAPPGQYTVRLTADGRSLTQTLIVRMDPRVKATPSGLSRQFELASRINAAEGDLAAALREANSVREQMQALSNNSPSGAIAQALAALDRKTAAILGTPLSQYERASRSASASNRTSLRFLGAALEELERAVESADAAPTPDAVAAFDLQQQAVQKALGEWQAIKDQDLHELNALLRQANLSLILPNRPAR